MNRNVVKGLLIILVIFDHNEYAHIIFKDFLLGFSFHVVGFFSLPFLLNENKIKRMSLERIFFSYYYPFLWMVGGMALVTIVTKTGLSTDIITNIGFALYSGSDVVLKQVTQMALLWFLPSFISIILIRDYIFFHGTGRKITIAAFIVFHVFVGSFDRSSHIYFPLGLLPAVYAIPCALLVVKVNIEILSKINRFAGLLVATVLFFLVKFMQIKMESSQELGFALVADYSNPAALFINDMEAVTGVLLIFQIGRFNFWGWLDSVGKNSLVIYLLHAYISFVVFRAIGMLGNNIGVGLSFVASLLITVILSGLAGKYVMESKICKRFLFPRCWQDLVGKSSKSRILV